MPLHDDVPQVLKVLLVEDDRMQTIMVEAAFARLPQLDLTYVAKDGVEAMEFLRSKVECVNEQLPDLILLDINMPNKDGFEVLVELKSDPVLCRIPTIMFSTSDYQGDIDRAYEDGASTFIAKPLTLSDLTQALDRIANYWVKAARLPTHIPMARKTEPRTWRSAS
jgi:chemotaxis family two-component system response regulator Rcp1